MNESATSNLLNTTQVIEGNLGNYIEKDFESLNVVGGLYKSGFNWEDDTFAVLCKDRGFEWLGAAGKAGSSMGSDGVAFELSQKSWFSQWTPEQSGYSDAYYGESGRLQTTLWCPVYEDNQLIGTVFGDVLLSKYYSANIFSNVDSVFLIYDKRKKETVFVSDNVSRILGLNRQKLQMAAGQLFDWCGIGPSDPLRTAFLEGTLGKSESCEVCVDNVAGLKTRFIRLELIPADMEQEIALLTDITADKDIQNSLRDAMERAESASRTKDGIETARRIRSEVGDSLPKCQNYQKKLEAIKYRKVNGHWLWRITSSTAR